MKKMPPIPVNQFGGDELVIERFTFDDLPALGEWEQPERHDRHSFFLVEKGSVTLEIDFERYEISAPSVIYMHPDQVHRIIGFEKVSALAWAVPHEYLNPEFLTGLEAIAPVAPRHLQTDEFALLLDTALLALKFTDRRAILNALIGLTISILGASTDRSNRFEIVTKSFKQALDKQYSVLKRPADYAQQLNISVAYLNECVKNATGYSVSHHIQERIILQAKRLLYHSTCSLKEISAQLGFDDYAYFSRLFTKVTGASPVSFRSKNHD